MEEMSSVNRRLLSLGFVVIAFPSVKKVLDFLYPFQVGIYGFGGPQSIPLWLLLAYFGWFGLTLLFYPVLFFVVVYFLAKPMSVSKGVMMVTLAAASVVGSAAPIFVAYMLTTPFSSWYNALQGRDPLWSLLSPTIPLTTASAATYEFLIALGAVALPLLLSKWKSAAKLADVQQFDKKRGVP
jgi:hypothetical protein